MIGATFEKSAFFLMVCTRSMGAVPPYIPTIYNIGKRSIVQRVLCRKRKKKEIAVLFRKDLRPPLSLTYFKQSCNGCK